MIKPLLLSTAVLTCGALNAQNTCQTAVQLGEGTYQVQQIDGLGSPVACLFGTPNLAEWYSFTSPVDTGVVITTNIAGLPEVDTRIQVYSGVCGALECYASDDDGGGSLTSLVEFTALANVTYTIIFDNNWTAAGFSFRLSLFPPPPPPVNLIDFQATSIPGLTYSMGLVDMNDDQRDDLVAPSTNQVRIGYQQANGTYTFVNIPTTPADHTASWSLCVGDLDKNGANDLMYGAGQGVTFMYANGDGTAFTERSYSEYVFCQRTNMVDLNNDGHL
ncbi:MAG: FG-GAP repeat domain-containing protein, partial [Flavobacteriales bacterium]